MADKTLKANSWWLNRWYPLLWFAIGAFVIYGQSIGFTYTYLDDTNLILNQLGNIGHVSYIPQAFREDVFHTPGGGGFYYRPMLTVSFVLDAVTGNSSLKFFHFSNIVFHILATYLLFLCLVALRYDRLKSFLFALIFLFHPVVTQAVAWIPGRNDTLLAVFILASFLFSIRYFDSGKWQFLLLHAGSWFLALLTKETAMILPVLLLPAGILLFRAPKLKMIFLSVGWVLGAITWFTIRANVLGSESGYAISDSFSSLLRNLPAIFPFIGKCFFPFSLSVFPVMADMMVSTLLGFLGIILLVLMVYLSRPVKWGFFLFAISWFVLFLLPTFIKHTSSPDLTEHRVYLPLIGFILFFMESGPVRKMNLQKLLPKALTGGVIILFGLLTVLHMQSFKDRYAFWKNAVRTSPSHAYNYNTLGAMYFLDGDLEQADQYFRQSVKINPSEPQANGNIGLIAMRKGDLAEAETYYMKEISVNPLYDHVYFNYGILYYNKGKLDSACTAWEKTISINPGYADAYKALLMVYDTLHRQDDYYRVADMARKNGLIDTGQ